MSKLLDLYKSIASEIQLTSRLGKFLGELATTTSQIASGEVIAGSGLVGGGPLSSDVTLALSPTLEAAISGSGISALGAFGYLTQTDWAVDSVTGSDTNAGTTASPLKTLAELGRRWEGRTFDPSITLINVQLSGTFTGQCLSLHACVPSIAAVNVFANPSAAVASGTLTGYQQSDSTLRGSITDAAQNFTGLAPRRIRITGGTVPGAVTWFNSIAAATIANTGQFERIATPTASIGTTNPIVGDPYVVEDLVTQIERYDIAITGRGVFTLSGVIIGAAASTTVPRSRMRCSGATTGRVFGCLFLNPANGTQLVEGDTVLGACSNRNVSGSGALTLTAGVMTLQGHCHFGFSQIFTGANVTGNRALHDGNGTANVTLFIGNGTYLEDIGDRGFFGNVNSGSLVYHVRVEDFAQWVINGGTNTFWGAAGNTTTNALQVANGCGVSYATKPTATGAVPGNDVVLAAGAAIAWAAVPAIAASPDNAFVNVRH